jgi:MFS family permease
MEERPRLGHNVVVFSLVSLCQDAASELLYPVLPLFLTGVLGAPVAVVGFIEGAAEATASVTKVIGGRLADRRRRKPLIGAGYGIATFAKVLIAAATVWPLVLVGRVVDRIGKGIRTGPRDALLADGTPPAMRGRAFGFHRAADTTGAVIGPLLALGMYEAAHHHIRPVLIAAVVPAVISVALTSLIRELPKTAPAGGIGQAAIQTHGLPRAYWRVVGFLTLFGIVNFTDALIILRAKALGLGFVAIVTVYAAYNASYAALSYPAGALSDRIPRRWVFSVGLAVFAVSYLGLGLLTHHTRNYVWLLLPVYGMYTALTDGVGKAWIADLLPSERMGSGLGFYQGITGGASLIAGIWAGLAWHGTGRLPLIFSGSVVAVLAVVLMVGGKRLDGAAKAGERPATART